MCTCVARVLASVTLHFFLSFETGSLAEPESHCLGWLSKELQIAICPISQVLVSQVCAATPGSTLLTCGSCVLALIHA